MPPFSPHRKRLKRIVPVAPPARIKPVSKHRKRKVPSWAKNYYVFLALDYSQVEIRMLAEAANDRKLISQFKQGFDIHCIVGETLTGIPAKTIRDDKPTRTFIKNFHFGMVYGLDGEGLFYYCKAKGIKTTVKKCTKFRAKYFEEYKGVARFITQMQQFARDHHYVESIFGFRRKLGKTWEEKRTTNPENQAVNSPIQGAAHNLLLIALALLSNKPKKYNYLQKPIAEIHDALIFRVRLDRLANAWAQAKALMEVDIPVIVKQWYGREIRVPLVADAKAGFRMGSMVDYKGESVVGFLKNWDEHNKKVEADLAEKYKKAA